MQSMAECPTTGLVLPTKFIDEKIALKKVIDKYVEDAVNANQHIDGTYFLVFHGKFDPLDPGTFKIDPASVTPTLPPFVTNQIVFWVNNRKGICELLWIVGTKGPDGKYNIEFNKEGVAYLQAKGAMDSPT